MSNLGFSLDRDFSASDAARRRVRGLTPVAATARQTSGRWTPSPFAGLALAAALFCALAAKFLF
jgi:hypothetical protein